MIARSLVVALLAVLTLTLTRLAAAEPYPSRPVTLVVPFPPGGPTDALGRLVSERMAKVLGQSVIIENASGAGGTVGTAKVARAPADGYTVSVGQLNSHVFGAAVYNPPYDVLNDFEPVGMISISALMMVGRAGLAPNSIAELVTWMKAKAEPATFGTVGAGSPAHVWTFGFTTVTGARFQLIPYRGAAPTIQDMLAGRIDLTALEASNLLPHVQAGKMKPYAILSAARWKIAPDIPTMAEAGFPGYEMPFWTGLFVRKGTPPEAIARLNAALVESLADPALQKRLTDIGQELPPPADRTPQALGARHRADAEKWWPLIKTANIKVE
jgi:tripartite-type tricarboxylate transporter receptor subunit TctC